MYQGLWTNEIRQLHYIQENGSKLQQTAFKKKTQKANVPCCPPEQQLYYISFETFRYETLIKQYKTRKISPSCIFQDLIIH